MNTSKRWPHLTSLLALSMLLLGAGCAAPFDTLEGLVGNLPSQTDPFEDIQLSPPAEILPIEGQVQGAGQRPVPVAASGSETPLASSPRASGPSASPGLTESPTQTLTQLLGTQAFTPTHSATPSVSATTTATLPPGITPSRTATSTQTVTTAFTLTHTPTNTASATWEVTPPPAPTATDTPEPTSPPACNPSGNGSFESALIALINQERQGRGLGALSAHGLLATAARNHSADMACNEFFSHTGSDGSMPWDRVSALGYSYSAIAENIFAGSSNAQIAFDAWMNSPGHHDNMLNPNYTEIGIGYRYWAGSPYGAYTTAVFARPR